MITQSFLIISYIEWEKGQNSTGITGTCVSYD
jgi:hypothetical protein